MEKQIQKHTKVTLYYALGQIFGSASFYGIRSIIVIYLMSETIKMERMQAINLYSWFGIALLISQVIGALLGDLVIGNRKAIILGGIFQSIGALCFCIPSILGGYIGLFFVVLGNGFYRTNIVSNFGKIYLNKTKLLDSGFAIFYLATSIGSFLGVLLIIYLVEDFNFNIGFLTAGIFGLLSIFPILISKENYPIEILKEKKYSNQLILKISILLLVVGLFWGTYELANIHSIGLLQNLGEISSIGMKQEFLPYINSSIFIIPICIIAIIVWTFLYSSSSFKLIIGFFLAAISYFFLVWIPELSSQNQIILYALTMLLLSISEIHIQPIISSILTKHTNPKYLAITFCISLLVTKFVSGVFLKLSQDCINNTTVELIFSIIIITVISIGFIIYSIKNKKNGAK